MVDEVAPETGNVRQHVTSALGVEAVALLVGGTAFVLGGFAAALIFGRDQHPISGSDSLGEFAGIAGAVVAALSFLMGRLVVSLGAHRPDPFDEHAVRLRVFDVGAIAIAHAVTALFGWIGLAAVLQRGFREATVYPTPSIVLVAAAIALSAYASFLSGANLTPGSLSLVLVAFLSVGVLAAMLSTSDTLWWQKNLSSLGITRDASARTFNLTLIVAGAIVTTIARFASASLCPRAQMRGRRGIVLTLLALIGIFLACIGILPVDRFQLLHNIAVVALVTSYAVLTSTLPWLVPNISRAFLVLGYIYVGAMVPLGLLFAVGVYNLTAVELVCAVLIFSWIIVLLRISGAMLVAHSDETAELPTPSQAVPRHSSSRRRVTIP